MTVVAMTYNEADKTHKGIDQRVSNKNPGMFAVPALEEECPVDSFELYVSKLNPDCDAFFQHPVSKGVAREDIWYANKPIGLNYLKSMMSKISEAAGLSQRYTNHCIRGSSATILGHAGLPSQAIMTVPGHRNESSLKSYINSTSVAQKEKMSTLLQSTATGLNINSKDQEDNQAALHVPQQSNNQLALPVPSQNSMSTGNAQSSSRNQVDMNIQSAVTKQSMDMSDFFNLQGASLNNTSFNIHIHN